MIFIIFKSIHRVKDRQRERVSEKRGTTTKLSSLTSFIQIVLL